MVDLDLKEIVHELGDVAWCEGKNFEDWVEPRVNAILQALAERDELKAELAIVNSTGIELLKQKNESAEHISILRKRIDVAEAELEAARKQEPFAYCFTDVNGKPTQFTDAPKYSHHNDLRVITPLYASPVPAQQAAEPIAFTENDLLEIASSYSAYAGADGDMYLNGWVKSYEAKGFISLINNRQRGQVMAEQLLKGGENER